MRAPHSVPTTSCTPDTPCGCGRTITLSDTDYPNMRMPFQHVTLAWEASYHRRVGIESLFADLKQNRMTMHRGFFRGLGIGRYTLLIGFTLSALNILTLHDWSARRGTSDPWGRYLGESMPERTPRRAAPPQSGRQVSHEVVGSHPRRQIATLPQQRNPRIPADDHVHPPKTTNYHAPVHRIHR
ncbi:hypothetical protein [Rhodococcus jostii]|uniref:hypothetical protein n=1 Tax=Rhodococcus jostii TaxID=132919 RepID=UPI00362D0DE2